MSITDRKGEEKMAVKKEKPTLRKLLKRADLHGSQLARRIDVSSAVVSAWCLGKAAPKYDMLPAIAEALGVSIEEVVKCFIKVE